MLKTLKFINYQGEQIDTLVNAKFATIIGNILAPSFALYLLYDYLNIFIIYLLLATQFTFLYLRLNLSKKIIRTKDLQLKTYYLKYYLLLIFLISSIVSILFLFIIHYTNEQTVLLYFSGILFLITGAMISLTPVYHAITIYVQTTLLFSIIGFIFIGESNLYNYLAFFTLIFLVMFTSASYKIYSLMANSIKQNITLKEKNESFQNLLDSTIEAIVITDIKTKKIIDGNEAALKLFKINKSEKNSIKGLSLFTFIPSSQSAKIKIALENNNNEPYEIIFNKITNELFPALVRSRYMIIDEKKVRVASILDLTYIKEKEQQLFSQSKLASMGEMIGNISHQWRQPLSLISTLASGVLIKKNPDTDYIENSMNKIIINSQYLSDTIDTFKNFLKNDKILEKVIIQKEIKTMISLFSSTLTDNNIKLINKIDMNNEISIELYSNELAQVIINIINNAKDILLEKNINDPIIILDLQNNKSSIIISIEDNAGGIPNNIVNKIFDPYFTTKHKSQGTGLGLHMSYNIVVNSLSGKLYTKNTLIGAKFFIELPLKNNI